MVDIVYFGHFCFKIRTKNASLVIDPFSQDNTGLKLPKLEADAVLFTDKDRGHYDLSRINNYRIVIDGPGEYEVGGVKILGTLAPGDNKNGRKGGINTVFEIRIEGISLVHLGDLGGKLTDEQIEALNGVDVLMIPVGGVYTLDSHLASEVVGQLEPSIVIPMHYKKPGLKLEIEPVENFLREMGEKKVVKLPKLSITKDKLPSELQIVILD